MISGMPSQSNFERFSASKGGSTCVVGSCNESWQWDALVAFYYIQTLLTTDRCRRIVIIDLFGSQRTRLQDIKKLTNTKKLVVLSRRDISSSSGKNEDHDQHQDIPYDLSLDDITFAIENSVSDLVEQDGMFAIFIFSFR